VPGVRVTSRAPAPEAGAPTRSPQASGPSRPTVPSRRLPVVAVAAVVAVVAAGLVLRFAATSPLWLDEAMSVNIAKLRVGDIPEALRHDGHPPLYYWLLHGWMAVFGRSDLAVRSLSGVFAVATLPLTWVAARRIGGRGAAVAALVLLATNPYAVRYATETRMYSMVMVIVLLGWLAVTSAVARPTGWRLAAIAVLSGVLLLTHYWAVYLLAAAGLVLLARRQWKVAAAVAAGGVLFLPWLASFLVQAGHTGTPWAGAVRPTTILMATLIDFGGGPPSEAQMLAFALAVLVALGLLGRAVDAHRLELDLRTRPEVRTEVLVVAATLALGCLAGYATSSAFASRYAAVVFPLVVLAAAVGVTRLAGPVARAGVLAAVAVLGLVGGARNVVVDRTQSAELADAVAATAEDGDLVVFCPDQLAPAVDRELPDRVERVPFPDPSSSPERVDWYDYAERNEAADVGSFAADVLARAGDRSVYLVIAPGYETFDEKCEALQATFTAARPGAAALVPARGDVFEHAGLLRFPAAAPGG
jgi:mannosyltransferase